MTSKGIVYLLGVVLLAIGILGFFNDPVLGVFEVDPTHNLVHIVSGLLALVFAGMGEASARTFGRIFGIVYGIVLFLGLITPDNTILGIMEINAADNFLHLILSATFLYVGFATSPRMQSAFAARDYRKDDDHDG